MEASKSLSCENNNISLFSALPESSNMYSNKDSNLISDIRDCFWISLSFLIQSKETKNFNLILSLSYLLNITTDEVILAHSDDLIFPKYTFIQMSSIAHLPNKIKLSRLCF